VLSWANSAMRVSASWPARVAASISVVSNMDVATSALHSKQYFSGCPGSPNKNVRRPQTLHSGLGGSSLLEDSSLLDHSSLPLWPHTM
jgi:hypothetical protein